MVGLNVGRIGTMARYNNITGDILRNQINYANASRKMSTRQRLLNNYDQINGARELSETTGRLSQQSQLIDNYTIAITELELADSSLANIKNILDTIKADALQGANETYGPDELAILGGQLRNLGENVYQLANTRLGEKYIFSGSQTEKKTVAFSPGDLFGNATYKEGASDIKERVIEDETSSVGLTQAFNQNAQSAYYLGSAFTAPLAANAEVNLTINDGSQEFFLGDVALAAGDSVAVIVTKINTAFTTAGGTGSIVQNNGGRLEFDTNLITGSVDNAAASISVSEGSTLPNTLADLGLAEGTHKGVSKDLRQTFNELESAYYSGDNSRVRDSLVDLDENLNRIVEALGDVGFITNKFEDLREQHNFLKDNVEIERADIAQVPLAEAVEKLNAAQNIINYTMNTGTQIMGLSIFSFI